VTLYLNISVVEWQVTAQEAEVKVTEMTKAVDELKKLLKQATHGECCAETGHWKLVLVIL